MMYEAEYIETGEPVVALTGDWRRRVAAVTMHEHTDTIPCLSFEEALQQFLALGEPHRQGGAARSGHLDAALDGEQPPNMPAAANNHSQSTSNHQPSELAVGADWQLELASVKTRAAELFPGGTATPTVKPRKPALVEKPTNELAMLVFDASKVIALIRGQLAREEVVGYLAADLLGIELLKEEALRLGESVRKAAAAAKDADTKLRNATSALKSKLKQKAQKEPEGTAVVHKLQRLDSELGIARAKLMQEEPKLNGLPDATTVIVERKPKPAASLVDYANAGNTSVAFWAVDRHPEIKGYRGRTGGGFDEERFWNPRKPPCVPSDERPAHLFNTRDAAVAASAASMVEAFEPPPYEDEYYIDEERYALWCVKHEHAVRRLREAFPEVDPCPMARASRHDTRPCPCGRGVLARWPWVVQTAQLGFCACGMAGWELTCWRSEWLGDVGRDLPL